MCISSSGYKWSLFSPIEFGFRKTGSDHSSLFETDYLDCVLRLYNWLMNIESEVKPPVSLLSQAIPDTFINVCVMILAVLHYFKPDSAVLVVTDGSTSSFPSVYINSSSWFEGSLPLLAHFKHTSKLVIVHKKYVSLISCVNPLNFLRLKLYCFTKKGNTLFELQSSDVQSPLTVLSDTSPEVLFLKDRLGLKTKLTSPYDAVLFGDLVIKKIPFDSEYHKDISIHEPTFSLISSNLSLNHLNKYSGLTKISLKSLFVNPFHGLKIRLVNARVAGIWPGSFSLGVTAHCDTCPELNTNGLHHNNDGSVSCLTCRRVFSPSLRFFLLLTDNQVCVPVLLSQQRALRFFELSCDIESVTPAMCKAVDVKYHYFFSRYSRSARPPVDYAPLYDIPLFLKNLKLLCLNGERPVIIYELFGLSLVKS